jgi:hypothetical protein
LIRSLAAPPGAVLVSLLSLNACTAEKPGSDRAHSTADPSDAGAVQDASTCHAEPPSRPNVDGGGGDADLVFAVTQAAYGTQSSSKDDTGNPLYLSYGFDLDDTCTGEGGPYSCIEPPWADAGHTDGYRGIDNAAGELLAQASPQQQDQGTFNHPTYANMIFRVRGYNDQPDDDQVDFAVYAAYGVVSRNLVGTSLQWDGQDKWIILQDTVGLIPNSEPPTYSVDLPLYHDDRAYVRGGVLVAHLPEALWPTGLAVAPSSLHMVKQLVFAGNLVQVGDQWELQHLVVGLRDPVQDILSLGARLLLPDGGPPLCASVFYQMFKRSLCSLVDISAEPDSPTNPCDALSGGSLLQAQQVLLGGIGGSSESIGFPACAQGIDPDHDTCGP